MTNEKFKFKSKAGARLLAFLTALALVAALLPLVEYPVLAAGYGTGGKFLAPIEAPIGGSTPISDREGLEAIVQNLSGNYHLTADIDLSNEEWVPILLMPPLGVPVGFTGILDGQGYVIKNLSISGAKNGLDGHYDFGLFGIVGTYNYDDGIPPMAVIKNLGLEGTSINISHSHDVSVGAISGTGRPNVIISNCYNSGNVSCTLNSGGTNYTGGIVGFSTGGEINNCYNTGNVSSVSEAYYAQSRAGGIVARADTTTIRKCYNTGNVSSQSTSNSSGDSYSTSYAGGITGDVAYAAISNCFNTGTVSIFGSSFAAAPTEQYVPVGNAFVGGIAGTYASGGGDANMISNCYNVGSVQSTHTSPAPSYVGGIVGYEFKPSSSENSGTIQNCVVLSASIQGENSGSGGSLSKYIIGYSAGGNLQKSGNLALDGITGGADDDTGDGTGDARISAEQAKLKATYANLGWDFVNIWEIAQDFDYPQLRGEPGQEPVYSATISGTATFPAADYGYTEPPAAQTFTVTNNGTEGLTNVAAALGTGIAFEISAELDPATIEAEGEATVSVRPITGLAAGEYADTLVITGDNGLSISAELSFTVSKAPLTITGATVGAKTYDGTTAANVTALTFDGLVDTETLALDTDYEIVSASFNSPDVADAENVSGTAALIDTGVTRNYALTGEFSQAATITPVSVSALPGVLNVQASTAKSYAFDLTAMLPEGVDPAQVSVYATGSVTGDDSILDGDPIVEGNILTVAVSDGAEAEQTAEIPIMFTSSNYNITGANITVTVTDKTVVELTSGAIEDKVYDGNAVSYEAVFDDGDVPAEDVTYTWSDGTAPKNAGDYTLTVALTNESDYVLSQPAVLRFAITKAPLTLTADDKAITAGGAIPVFTFTAGGFVGNDTWASVKGSDPALTSSAVNTAAGTYTITITGGTLNGEAGANYEITGRVSGTLTISASSWSGGGGVTTDPTPTPTPTPTPDAEGPDEPDEPAEPATPAETITKPPVTDAGFTVTLTKAKDYTETAFGDVADGAWYAETVKFAYEYGLFNGTSETQFSPNSAATRAQIITVLARAAGVETDGGANWYDKAVAWATANGISDGTNLDGNVTREQFATLLWRFAGEPEATGAAVSFTDSGEISGWAETAMSWAVSAGIITGYPGGNVNPGGHATRAEAAAMIKRYVEGAG